MWSLWFWSLLGAGLIGLALKYGLDFGKIQSSDTTYVYSGKRSKPTYFQISWIEFASVMAIIAIVVIPLTSMVGLKMAKQNKVTYHEFWNGYETGVSGFSRECHKNGDCADEYSCDPHEVYDYTDKDGNTHYKTEYDDCPVATRENYWTISTTLGDYDLGYTFDKDPIPWRGSHGLDSTFRGTPTLWLDAQKRVAAGNPGPVTKDKTYSNYILASTKSILHRYSSAVEKYRAKHMLPDPTLRNKHPIYDYYFADKMSFIGLPVSIRPWETSLAYLNAALGSNLQGDLHVAAVNANKVDNPDEYAGAVNAWWQDKKFGKRALSKNGIGLVLGVSGGTITWARAFTGMPVGNEGLVLDLRDKLKGVPFTPDIFKREGSPVQAALWGDHKFERVCMLCKGKNDSGVGYGYLSSEIQPSGGQKLAIILVSILFSILFWAVACFTVVGEKSER